jgi:hypothetical protein
VIDIPFTRLDEVMHHDPALTTEFVEQCSDFRFSIRAALETEMSVDYPVGHRP